MWSLCGSPKRSSRRGSRLTTIRHGGPPVLPPAKMGLYISNNIKRNTPLEGAGERLNRGVFLVTAAAPGCHTLRGGVVPRFHPTVWHFHIYISLSLLYSYPLLNRLHWADPGKIGRTIAPPQKGGGHVAPTEALSSTPLFGPHGSLSSSIIPAGRLGSEALTRQRQALPLSLVYSRSRRSE